MERSDIFDVLTPGREFSIDLHTPFLVTEYKKNIFIEGYLAAYDYLRECGIQLCTDGLVKEAQVQWEKYNERSNS